MPNTKQNEFDLNANEAVNYSIYRLSCFECCCWVNSNERLWTFQTISIHVFNVMMISLHGKRKLLQGITLYYIYFECKIII